MPGNSTGQKNSATEQKPTLSWSTPAQSAQPSSSAKSVATVIKEAKSAASGAQKPGSKKLMMIFGGSIILLVLVIGGIVIMNRKGVAPISTALTQEQTPSTNGESAASGATVSNGTLTLPNDQAAGLEIAITNASVSVPTWVVIYENHNGQPGNALGAALFTPERQSGTVELLRGTLPGQTYFAGLSRDDGDHIFSLQRDPAVRDENGDPVMLQFQTR